MFQRKIQFSYKATFFEKYRSSEQKLYFQRKLHVKKKKALKETNKEQGFFASLLGDSNEEIKEQKEILFLALVD